MDVKKRIALEKRIVHSAVRELLQAGFSLSVDNGGDDETAPMTDYGAINAALFATDEEKIRVYRGREQFGWLFVVYGNCGWDVLSDWTVNLDPFIAKTNTLSDKLSA